METFKIKNKLNNVFYSRIVKKIFFKFDEEKIHNFALKFGKTMGKNFVSKSIVGGLFDYQSKILNQNLLGIFFRNPIGLSAGFDKNAEIIDIMEDVGFGFVEVGSVTAKPCRGNTGKRLLRIPITFFFSFFAKTL